MVRVGLMAVLSAVLGLSVTAHALDVGDAAPELKVEKWVKGEPVDAIKPGQVYVVEFWATWCGPCRMTIPHLTELAQEYTDVTFVGVSVWEREAGKVEPFVEEMGDKMQYHVATDTNDFMADNWMKAAGQTGIPTAFIVGKDSNILWIGHPSSMKSVLAKVVDGTFTMDAAKQTALAARKLEEAMQKANRDLVFKAGPAVRAQKWDEALAAVDTIIADHPDAARQLYGVKMSVAQEGKNWDAFYVGLAGLVEKGSDDPAMLNEIVRSVLLSPKVERKDNDALLKHAQRIAELSGRKDAEILDTLALAYAAAGDKDKAIATEEEALSKARSERVKSELTKNLEKFKSGT